VRSGFYGPIFYDPWFYGGYGFGYPYPPYYAQGRYWPIDELTASIRLEVTPKNAEVYVDGYRAGTIDDFDGFFQRLRVRPGEHELTLYLDGYRSVHQRVYLSAGADQKIRYTLVPLPAGEPQEPRPETPQSFAPGGMNDQPPPGPPEPPRAGRRAGPPPPQGPIRRGPQPGMSATYGAVAIRVQPGDADVSIDGERWTSSGPTDRLVVQLSEGRHHIEIQKEGYERYATDIQVNRGDTVPLNVSLARR
jgi:hypothetical protein